MAHPSPPAPRSVLLVIASPDTGPSSVSIAAIAAELRRRGIRVTPIFLRGDPSPTEWPGARVVDHLRSWSLARTIEGLGRPKLAGRVRGLRLRAWIERARPDVVLLENGLGGRVESVVRRPHRTVVRLDSVGQVDPIEPRYLGMPDAVIVAPGCAGEADPRWQAAGLLQDTPISRAEGARARIRASLGVPEGALFVTGRGGDGWLDGPDLFIRALWELERRHGTQAHAAWFALTPDPAELGRLRDDVVRCGLADRVHVVDDPGDDSLGSGDVALLPYRDGTHAHVPMREIAAGTAVVSFPVWACTDPALHLVDHLDLAAAADAVLAVGRAEGPVAPGHDTRTGVEAWVDDFLAGGPAR